MTKVVTASSRLPQVAQRRSCEPKALASGLRANKGSTNRDPSWQVTFQTHSAKKPLDGLNVFTLRDPKLAPDVPDFGFERSELSPLSPAGDDPMRLNSVAGERARVRGKRKRKRTVRFGPSPQPSPPIQADPSSNIAPGERGLLLASRKSKDTAIQLAPTAHSGGRDGWKPSLRGRHD